MPAGVHEAFVTVGGAQIRLLKGGSGAPLLVLHGTEGSLGWRRYAQALADHFTVYLPSHPGFDGSERPVWLQSIFDLVCFYTWFLETQGLEGMSRHRVCPGRLARRRNGRDHPPCLQQNAARRCGGHQTAGGGDYRSVHPEPGADSRLDVLRRAQVPEYDQLYGHDPSPDEREQAVQNREMAVRLTWKPYMHDPRLPHLLARVTAPTRIVWGRQDKIIPVECGTLYQQAIPGADLVVLEQCGHAPHLEKPDAFVRVARQFLG